MTTITHPRAPGRAAGPKKDTRPTRTVQQAISGRYRPITTHQLAMGWWLYQAGHITRRQLRITFAAHEMAERRIAAAAQSSGGTGDRRPSYALKELKDLVGGRGTASADRELTADIRRLAELGLVTITESSIGFATSIEQIHIEEGLTSFWAFFEALPRQRGRVPVPRRTLRALAAGFPRAETAFVIAALIRSVFWHKKTGEYTTDGRTKLSWVAQTFGISRRAATDARTRLVELGWLLPQQTPQWALNKWGVHDVVNVDWSPKFVTPVEAEPSPTGRDLGAATVVGEGGGSASPRPENAGGSASPCLDRSPLSTRDSRTRTLGARAPDPSGDFVSSSDRRPGSRKGRGRSGRAGVAPNIRDIRIEDLRDLGALRELRSQAVALGFAFSSESGELDFFALANRARTRGHNPPALFYDLISKHRTGFITFADEDAARGQLRELREGPSSRASTPGRGGSEPPETPKLTEVECLVEACLRVANERGIEDPYRIAQKAKNWTREEWDDAHLAYRTAQSQRWLAAAGEQE